MTAQAATRRIQRQPQRLSEPAGQRVSTHARNTLNSACPVATKGRRRSRAPDRPDLRASADDRRGGPGRAERRLS